MSELSKKSKNILTETARGKGHIIFTASLSGYHFQYGSEDELVQLGSEDYCKIKDSLNELESNSFIEKVDSGIYSITSKGRQLAELLDGKE